MRLVVVVLDLAEVFAGNSEVVRQIVVAGGDDQLACAMVQRAAEAVLVCTVKLPSAPVLARRVSYWRTLRR